MKKTMKQMLTALLAVAMIASLLVVPGVAANDEGGAAGVNYYSVTLDTNVVNVYANEADTVTVTAEGGAVYAVSADASVATATVAGNKVTVTGVAEGTTDVYVVAADAAVTTVAAAQAAADKLAVVTVTVAAKEEEPTAPTTGIFTLDVTEMVTAGKLEAGKEFPDVQPNPATQVPELGTDGLFTLITKKSGGMKPDAKEVTFADGYKGTNFIKFGGNISDANAIVEKMEDEGKCVKFTTGDTSTVKVWWTHSKDTAQMGLAVVVGEEVTLLKADGAAKNEPGVSVFENVPAGTCYLFGSTTGPNLYKVEVNIGNTVAPVALTGKYTFDATKIAVTAANTAVTNDLVKAATTVDTTDATPVEAMFTVDGTVTTKWETDPVAFAGAVELAKKEAGKIIFTIPEGSTATVTVAACSTNTTNESAYAMKKDGTVVANDGELVSVVVGDTATMIVYTDLGAGTYEIVSPEDAARSRGTRIVSVEVDFGGTTVVPGPGPDDPGTDPADTAALTAAIADATKLAGTYTVRPDTTVASNVNNGNKYVLQKDKDALVAAIAAAQAVADKEDATQDEVDAAVADLAAAMDAFNAAVKTGTKTGGGNTSSSSIRDDGRGEQPTQPSIVANFTDVPTDSWFADSVKYCVEKKLVNGTSDTTFEPAMSTTRGMVMTVLARLAGVDTTAGEGETWYTKGMEWAVEQGISDGTNPEAVITREQLAVMLYRYAKAEAVENAMDFVDADQISDWAVEGMTWAVSKNIVLGKGAQDLDPQGVCSRAELVTMLARFCKL